ncbi:alpha/beta hydrolase family protein [Mycobacteroides franklinii]|uniref:Alpha/beta hydrolase family protein n=1 Tax=Mycobacteroides franklinii TaxID=948102 RepID=A0A4R8QZL3_9MYCO|nr:alpha/beta hydrolase [Mycobacteroides franklinii]TDZ45771.1 Alpha/beta hydrolase family protein [Mycobacteroides franklinii]TDZ49261.1 Alpha/beta hydrolase family protein [Mycobacteroides franklinii]TDZ59441.1 Alpha/beta hydrolase family protein [Mycobacteroides franklinii]TDZ66956.1 Alpha/beta hydrolase family protein [Mycobacteroides franklinii]TDZ72880.1 Alpha/beta hydrolase family protein [Mycobacteroides franklinii]
MPNDDQAQAAFDSFVDMWTTGTTAGRRAPVLRRPDEVGLEYEDVSFPSMDGVPLEGWFIPADSDRLIIHNHFLPGNRYGFPGHLPEFNIQGGFEVNQLPEYKALHDAGYNILAYDIRNHGMSGQGSGGISGVGLMEYRDVIGSLRYAAARPDTTTMKKALLSVCMGADSTAIAWSKHPDEFSEVQAMVMLQPFSARYLVEEFIKAIGMENGYERFEKAAHARTGFHLSEQSPLEHVKAVTVPTLVAQVHDDTQTRPQDVQDIYDAIPVAEKSLYWIEGTNRRFDGYNFFGVHPEIPIDWFNKHIN